MTSGMDTARQGVLISRVTLSRAVWEVASRCGMAGRDECDGGVAWHVCAMSVWARQARRAEFQGDAQSVCVRGRALPWHVRAS